MILISCSRIVRELNTPSLKRLKHLLHFYLIVPCQFTTYNTETISYDRNSKITHNTIETSIQIANMNIEPKENGTVIIFTYPTMDTVVTQNVKILDASSFISSVGGNLGLFIGFSFLDSLFVLYKWLCTRSSK